MAPVGSTHSATVPASPHKLDCCVAASPLHKRLAFVAGNNGNDAYLGCGTIRIYGFGDFQPCG